MIFISYNFSATTNRGHFRIALNSIKGMYVFSFPSNFPSIYKLRVSLNIGRIIDSRTFGLSYYIRYNAKLFFLRTCFFFSCSCLAKIAFQHFSPAWRMISNFHVSGSFPCLLKILYSIQTFCHFLSEIRAYVLPVADEYAEPQLHIYPRKISAVHISN